MKKNLLLTGVLLLCLIIPSLLIAQQDGMADPTFGINGRLNIYASGGNDNVYSVIVLPDGKILFGGHAEYGGAGSGDIYIGKLSSTGNFDVTFGSSGFVTSTNGTYSDVRDLALMNDGSILFGGSKTGSYRGASVGRLNPDGTFQVTPTGPHFVSTTINNESWAMAYNATANKLAIGGFVYQTTSFSFVHKFNVDGTLDLGFSANGNYYFGDTPQQNVTYSKAVAMLDDGSVLLPAIYGASLMLVKFRPDGTLDGGFGTSGIAQYTFGSGNVTAESILVLPDGKIMVGGSFNNDLVLVRFNSNGTYDNTFNAPAYNYSPMGAEGYNSMVVQPDGKIIASGSNTYTTPIGIVARYNTNGSLDTTFGTSGVVTMPGFKINCSSISTIDKTVILAGSTSGQFGLAKLKYEIQKYNIIGKDVVSVESENTYQIHPVQPTYSYYWSYSGTGGIPVTTTTGSEFTLYFNKNTTDGILYCDIYDQGGNFIKKAQKSITINQEQTLAELLADVQCDPAQTYAQSNYINAFKFVKTKVSSSNTGPSLTGYGDYTASSNYDTLYSGDNYQAELECVTNYGGVVYCGMWIDYDNNGKLTDNEFVGSSASESKIFNVNNIVIPVDAEQGVKRVRVRVRQSAPFLAYEGCIANEELSETEDYLIVLNSYDEIQAPNFITPNNDGKNDNFIVRGAKKDVNNSLKIFNRVGDLVYEKDNYDNSWGGTVDGGQLKAGTYYFVFTQPNTEKAKNDIVKGFFEIRY